MGYPLTTAEKHQRLERMFALIERAAIDRVRCPQNHELGVNGDEFLHALARENRLRIEISGANYRTVTLLTGPNVGKTTAPDPKGAHVFLVIDGSGSFFKGKPYTVQSRKDRRAERSAERRARVLELEAQRRQAAERKLSDEIR